MDINGAESESPANKAANSINRQLDSLDAQLGELYENGEMDGFLLYLYGIVLSKRTQKEKATLILVESVTKYPLNWSAWQELALILATLDQLDSIIDSIPESIMKTMFVIHTRLDVNSNMLEVAPLLDQATQIFPTSSFLKFQRANMHYNSREFVEAIDIFEKILKDDEHILDHMDIYSNALFVMGHTVELSDLAHRCVVTDRYRPETCCVIGTWNMRLFIL